MTAVRHRWSVAAAALVAAALAVPAGAAVPAALTAEAAACAAVPAQPGFTPLFDGSSVDGWKHSGPGSVTVNAACELETAGGLGLFWYEKKAFEAYTLRLDWKIEKVVDNSGVFIGFPADGNSTHNTAISKGYEVQIDQIGRTTGDRKLITGAIYNVQGPNRDTRTEVAKPRDWNTYEITVDAPKVKIVLNGVLVNEFTAASTSRPITFPGAMTHFGLQAHGTGDVTYFRNVQVKEIAPGSAGGAGGTPPGGGGGGVDPGPVNTGPLASLRNNTGIYQNGGNASFDGGNFAYDANAMALAGVTPGGKITSGGATFTWPSTPAGQADNVIAGGQTVTVPAKPGATRLSVLGAGGGNTSANLTLNYVDAGGVRTTEAAGIAFADWTLGVGALGAPAPGTRIAVEALARAAVVNGVGAPTPTRTFVFATDVALDPTRLLESVTLGSGTGALHVFDLVTG